MTAQPHFAVANAQQRNQHNERNRRAFACIMNRIDPLCEPYHEIMIRSTTTVSEHMTSYHKLAIYHFRRNRFSNTKRNGKVWTSILLKERKSVGGRSYGAPAPHIDPQTRPDTSLTHSTRKTSIPHDLTAAADLFTRRMHRCE